MIKWNSLKTLNSFYVDFCFSKLSALTFLAIMIAGTLSFGVPLSDSVITRSKRVVLVPGSFDPINKSHIRFAQTLVEKYSSDLVILIPTTAPLHKAVSNLSLRESLIHAALKDDPNISYPHDSTWMELVTKANYFSPEFITRMRTLNPSVQIGIAVGADVAQKNIAKLYFDLKIKPDKYVVVSGERGDRNSASYFWRKADVDYVEGSRDTVSSTEARNILREHTELYFMNDSDLPNEPNFTELTRIIPSEAAHLILNDGLYLDRKVGGSVSKLEKFKRILANKFLSLAEKLNLGHSLESFMVWYHSSPTRKDISVGANTFGITKYLRSDAFTDSYVIAKNNQAYVITVANRRTQSQKEILRRIPIQMWAEHKMKIPTPPLIDFDPEGQWMITEFWQGEPAPDRALENSSSLEISQSEREDFFRKINSFAFKTGIKLSSKDKTFYVDPNGHLFLNFINIEDNTKSSPSKGNVLASERILSKNVYEFSKAACAKSLSEN